MVWKSGPISVYHGTDSVSAATIRSKGIDPTKFRPDTDFGAGFYVTTVLHQAEQWANQRCRRLGSTARAEVLQYDVSRNVIETLAHLAFVLDDAAYYDFVGFCRRGNVNHGPSRTAAYDVIYGPVSLWPQMLAIADCDQILFSRPSALADFNSPVLSRSPAAGQMFF